MTVFELMQKLQQFPPDAEVKAFMPFDCEGTCEWVRPSVDLMPDGTVQIEPDPE